MKNSVSKKLVASALIAAIYAAATLILAPISFGAVQLRVSEALCVLPAFAGCAVPGLAVGCFISGLLGPNGIVDALIGSLCTLIGAFAVYSLRKKPYLGLLVNVLVNSLGIGAMMKYVYDVNLPLPIIMGYIAIGESISCFLFGVILMRYLNKHKKDFFEGLC